LESEEGLNHASRTTEEEKRSARKIGASKATTPFDLRRAQPPLTEVIYYFNVEAVEIVPIFYLDRKPPQERSELHQRLA
jgi:hypothetical protein